MGWGKIRKAIHKVADRVEPTAVVYKFATKNKSIANLSKNVEAEGTKGVANYGGYAGVVAQVIPGAGTAVGAGLIAASVAANIKLKQDAIRKQNAQNNEQQAAWAREDAANLAAASGAANPDDAAFTPTTPPAATTMDPQGRMSPPFVNPKRIVSDPVNRGANVAANFLNDVFPTQATTGTTSSRLMMTGAAPMGGDVASTAELQTGATPKSFFARNKTIFIVGGLVVLASVAVLAVVRR
jgi:hypothetical protein